MTRVYKKNREDFGALRNRNGRHQASYLGPDGKRYYAPQTFGSKTDGRVWLDAVRTDIARGTWVAPNSEKDKEFGEYARLWIAQRVSTKGEPLRPKTRREYERQLERGLADFNEIFLSQISMSRVRSWHAKRMKAGMTAAAVEARLLRAILSTAVEDGIIENVPVPTKLTKTSAGKSYRPPTLEELAVLHDRVEARFKLAVLIAAYGGLRISEWRALRRSDFTFNGTQWVIDVQRQAEHVTGEGWVVGKPKSDHGTRLVALPSWMTTTVENHIEAWVSEAPGALLFAPKGSAVFMHNSAFYKSWKPAQKAAGVFGEVREHDLRDFAGSHLLAVGANVLEVRDFLGHADVRTTSMHYLHRVNNRAFQLANAMPQLPALGAMAIASSEAA